MNEDFVKDFIACNQEVTLQKDDTVDDKFVDKMLNVKAYVVNEMATGDFEKLVDILFKEDISPLSLNDSYFASYKMSKLGYGNFGNVYEFVGSDGYSYAVKIARFEKDNYSEHDATILSKLQSIKGYNKLFCYFEGTCTYDSWGNVRKRDFLIMVSKKVYGFRISDALRNEFCKRNFFDNIGPEVIQEFQKTIKETYLNGYFPDDIHSENVMVDMDEKQVVIVDVGCYTQTEVKDDISEEMVKDKVYASRLIDLCGQSNIFCRDGQKYHVEVKTKNDRETYKF
jgi:hypothetical protein